ncbi:hypothetical protein DSL62_00930 [Pantoea sp. 3_1284]|nr:hypothetical protein DSL62_00930 [Pantoea sp. 3_1284]
MTICCSQCGSKKFFYTCQRSEPSEPAAHHGARCAVCRKPLNSSDVKPPEIAVREAIVRYAR